MEIEGQKQLVNFDFDNFKNMWFNVRADVGESSYWSEIAAIQTLDNLLAQGHIDIIAYLERVPDEYIPQKEELLSQIKQTMQMQHEQQAMQDQMMAQDQMAQEQQAAEQEQLMAVEDIAAKEEKAPHLFDQLLAQLPKHQQRAFDKLSPAEQDAIMNQLIAEQEAQ
jgi:hypothetical protein